jgi:hypothetical protein
MTKLSVDATSTRMPATASVIEGPSNHDVFFRIGAGSFAQDIATVTNDEGDVSVEFVPQHAGPLKVEFYEVHAPEMTASVEVNIGT